MAPRKKSDRLTPLETEIMNLLWEISPATAQTVRERLERELAYTPAQTMFNVLVRKKKAKLTLKNHSYYYRPVVSRGQVAGSAVKDLIDRLFGGSAESLVMSLVESRRLTSEKLARLHRMLKAKEARDGND
jgi:BlaI family transcriptional regulator, penicillinase repressor